MFIALFSLALLQCLQGAPLHDPQSTVLASNATQPGSSPDARSQLQLGTRTESDIIITCLATIFACTWTAIHPNIPAPNDSSIDTFKRRIRMTLYALIAPEAITTFAMRQWLGAIEIANKYNEWAEKRNQGMETRCPTISSVEQLSYFGSTRLDTEDLDRENYATANVSEGNIAPEEPEAVYPSNLSMGHSSTGTLETHSAAAYDTIGRIRSVSFSLTDKDSFRTSGIAQSSQGNAEQTRRWKLVPSLMAKLSYRPVPTERMNHETMRWTTAHGFFIQMGGYIVSKKGIPLFTVSSDNQIGDASATSTISGATSNYASNIYDLVDKKMIEPPSITEAEIQDRSKGDAISKTFVILQTSWFFIQCIARWSAGLVVTELEVITLGFVALNGLTYMFWWHKPQNVNVPVYLEWTATRVPPNPRKYTRKQSMFMRRLQSSRNTGASVLKTVWMLIITPLVPIASLIMDKDYFGETSVPLRVSMFHSHMSEASSKQVDLWMSLVASIFGGIHLALSWFVAFPSQGYMITWRVCAIILTFVPLTVVPICSIIVRSRNSLLTRLTGISTVILAILYITSRITLIVLSLSSLQHLPFDALTSITWLSSFPHI